MKKKQKQKKQIKWKLWIEFEGDVIEVLPTTLILPLIVIFVTIFVEVVLAKANEVIVVGLTLFFKSSTYVQTFD